MTRRDDVYSGGIVLMSSCLMFYCAVYRRVVSDVILSDVILSCLLQGIVSDVQLAYRMMLTQLVSQLRTNIQLPQCLKVIGM